MSLLCSPFLFSLKLKKNEFNISFNNARYFLQQTIN
jgi:hypothetical protein